MGKDFSTEVAAESASGGSVIVSIDELDSRFALGRELRRNIKRFVSHHPTIRNRSFADTGSNHCVSSITSSRVRSSATESKRSNKAAVMFSKSVSESCADGASVNGFSNSVKRFRLVKVSGLHPSAPGS